MIDRDRLMNADSEQVAALMVLIFDRLQQYSRMREQRVLAMAATFLLSCDALGVKASDAMSAVVNLMKDELTSSGMKAQFQAMRYHLDEDILKGGRL